MGLNPLSWFQDLFECQVQEGISAHKYHYQSLYSKYFSGKRSLSSVSNANSIGQNKEGTSFKGDGSENNVSRYLINYFHAPNKRQRPSYSKANDFDGSESYPLGIEYNKRGIGPEGPIDAASSEQRQGHSPSPSRGNIGKSEVESRLERSKEVYRRSASEDPSLIDAKELLAGLNTVDYPHFPNEASLAVDRVGISTDEFELYGLVNGGLRNSDNELIRNGFVGVDKNKCVKSTLEDSGVSDISGSTYSLDELDCKSRLSNYSIPDQNFDESDIHSESSIETEVNKSSFSKPNSTIGNKLKLMIHFARSRFPVISDDDDDFLAKRSKKEINERIHDHLKCKICIRNNLSEDTQNSFPLKPDLFTDVAQR